LEAGHQVAATFRNTENLIEAVSFRGDAFLPLSVKLGNDENVATTMQQANQHFGRTGRSEQPFRSPQPWTIPNSW
jgi:hypothetical protein